MGHPLYFQLRFLPNPTQNLLITTVQGLWCISFCLVVISVQLLNFFTRKKYRVADEHFVYFISQLRFLIGMSAESRLSVLYFLSVITLKWNGEGEEGKQGCRLMGECMHMTVPAQLLWSAVS